MSEPNDAYNTGPVFDQPEGVNPYGEEQTLPYVDLYPQTDNLGGASSQSAGGGQWNPRAYGGGPQDGGSNPSQPYAGSPYQSSTPYGSNPHQHPMAVPPSQQQWGQYAYAPPEHPQATTVLVLGVVGFAVPVTAFIAWYMGNKAKAEIEQGAPFQYAGTLKTGHIIGKVVSIISIVGIALSLVFMVLYFILLGAIFTSF